MNSRLSRVQRKTVSGVGQDDVDTVTTINRLRPVCANISAGSSWILRRNKITSQ